MGGIDHQQQADFMDLSRLSKFNEGIKYLMTCINVLSKYAWVVPLKDKTSKSLVEVFWKIFDTGR